MSSSARGGPDDYAIVGAHFSCTDASPGAAPSTNGPPALGALAAARAALLCEQLLLASGRHVEAGMQITLAVREHRLVETRFRRNPTCRFDHCTLPLDSLTTTPQTRTLREIDRWMPGTGANGGWRLAVDGCDVATRVSCESCGRVRDGLRVVRPHSGVALRCDCGGGLRAAPLDSTSHIDRARLTDRQLGLSLADIGLHDGDILGHRIPGLASKRSRSPTRRRPSACVRCAIPAKASTRPM